MQASELETLLYKKSGLLGLSGISNDMRALLESAEPRARLAVDYFVHHTARQVGGLTAVLGGLDALVFTAGIGEHSALIRARIMRACAWLGVKINSEANEHNKSCISSKDSAVRVFVIPTNEELMIARHTYAKVTES
jgi:acetate kinase